VEITIGVRDLPREITLESDQSADDVAAAVAAALAGKPALELVDNHGRRVIVPITALGYVEIGAETRVRVGFGSL
jgi:phage tail sheath gpL-like